MKNLNELPLIYYTLTMSCPAPTKKVKDKEAQLSSEAGAELGTYRVSAEKIPNKYQGPISSIQGKIRAHFDKNCFRINDVYGVPIQQYQRFESSYADLIQQHDTYVNALCDAIETGELMQEARKRMGDDFDASVLPQVTDDVRRKFSVTISTVADLSSPVINDALSKLAETTKLEVENRIRIDQAKAEADGQANIVSFVMDEIVEYLKDIQHRVGTNAKGARYQTILDKFTRITEQLPAYNITENPQISSAIDRIYETFKSLDKDTLKKDALCRDKTVNEAKLILTDITDGNLF